MISQMIIQRLDTSVFQQIQADGGVFLIDKPLHWTSFDVVNKLRYTLIKRTGNKKLKVGHAGTLDPLATGLLIVCVGKMTKRINEWMDANKTYTGAITLGATRPSFDLETEIDNVFPTEHISDELVEKARLLFLGAIEQYPPIYSAIKVGGQPLYKSARLGLDVEIKARTVQLYKFDLKRNNLTEIAFEVTCSKGTYIRSLAADFGKACASGAYLSSLVRTQNGDFSLQQAWKLEDLIQQLSCL
jgi:tRNA pseudouridine55 synthase